MTTNEIEKQLRAKALQQIKLTADDIVSELRGFGATHTGKTKSCLSWYSKAHKEHAMYDHQDAPSDPWCSYDWNELKQLITRNMETNYLDQMVEKKAKDLLSKIDLLG